MENNPQFPGMQHLHPPMAGPMDPQRGFITPVPVHFRPAIPAPPSQQFIPIPSQHYQTHGPAAPMMNVGLPSQNQQPQFSQPMQQLPPRPPPQPLNFPSQTIPPPVARPNMHMTSDPMMSQLDPQSANGYGPGLGGPAMPVSSSYAFAPSPFGQLQMNYNAPTHYQPVSQAPTSSVASVETSRMQSESQNSTSGTVFQTGGEPSNAAALPLNPQKQFSTEWIEHTSANGRRFYYNKKTKLSVWEKPLELMTPIERADASTNWKEYTSPDGRKYYYNKVTKESKWTIPEELKLAREQVEKASLKSTQTEAITNPHNQPSASPSVVEAPHTDVSSTNHGASSSPVSVAPVIAVPSVNDTNSRSSSSSHVAPSAGLNDNGIVGAVKDTGAPADASPKGEGCIVPDINTCTELRNESNELSAKDGPHSAERVTDKEVEDVHQDLLEKTHNDMASDLKTVEREPLLYTNKTEAKNSFKALLESADIGSDWTWDRAMRVIINDKRYGALKTLGEKKQAFNEYLSQRKKQEAEEKRIKLKKAREEFRKMLEESTELTSSARWSKVVPMFENDERFKAVERDRDRREIFDSFLEEVTEKERARVQEERKKNIMEYRKFLESCDFIKASTQWRKVQDRLESDERCSRLDKMDRLEIFQDYLRDLEKEEEEQRKIQKEEIRKAERKNRDEFRKLMEEHVSEGLLTAKTQWRDYSLKLKDLPAYVAVASNTSGSTPKELFEDVVEELEKQYQDDKGRIKDAVKLGKIMVSSTWTIEDFKTAIVEDISSPPVSDVNLKLVFDELLERVREKEEKETKRRKRLADDFFNLLSSIKDINTSSKWEDHISLLEDCQEFRLIGDECICKEIFEQYIAQLKEEAKEIVRKRKEDRAKKEKEREERERRKRHKREKEGGREKEKDDLLKEGVDDEDADITDTQNSKEDKRTGEEDGRKRKQHRDGEEEVEKDRKKKSHGHSGDHKKSRRHSYGHDEGESRHKRHKRDHRNGSRRDGEHELEDGEFGDNVERW